MRRSVAFGAIVALTAATAMAQAWRGAEAVRLQVKDSKGRPLQGARVTLTFQGVPGELGPAIVATDANGSATLAELAPGPWQVDVQHPEFLSYVAMIDVRRGKKPLVSASFLEARGRSLSPIRVKFSKGDPGRASPVLEARQAPREAPAPVTPRAPAESLPASADAAATPQQPVIPQGEPRPEPPATEPTPAAPSEVPAVPAAPATAPPAPIPPAPAVEPEPAAEEAPAAVVQPQPPVTAPPSPPPPAPPPEMPPPLPEVVPETPAERVPPRPAAPPAPEPTPAAPSEAPAEEAPAAVVQPQPPVTATPSPPPTAPPVARDALPPPPDPGPVVGSYRDGSCADCDTGEWSLTVSAAVPAAADVGACGAPLAEAARAAMRGLSESIQLELYSFIGPVADGSPQQALERAESDFSAPLRGELAPFVAGASPCQIVAAVLPKAVRFTRVHYAASDQQGRQSCPPGRECPIGEARWLGTAAVESGPSTTVVYALFENQSSSRDRRAHLTVFFRPPDAHWRPRLPAGR